MRKGVSAWKIKIGFFFSCTYRIYGFKEVSLFRVNTAFSFYFSLFQQALINHLKDMLQRHKFRAIIVSIKNAMNKISTRA